MHLSQVNVTIAKGFYRGQPVVGTFPMVKEWQEGARGGFVTIEHPNPKAPAPPVQRIQCKKEDITLTNADGSEYVATLLVSEGGPESQEESQYEAQLHLLETDDEAMARIADTFAMQDKLTDAVAKGKIRGIVISGPPGIGKSFGVERQLETANMFLTLAKKDPMYRIVTGGVSPIGLYQLLWENRKPKQVLVFDDCDSVLFEEESLSLLKGALNSGDKRRIAWNKESRLLAGLEIDSAFDFEGSIMFLSNVDFEKSIARGSRISDHLKAIMSRCHYLDLEISSTRDKLLRIKQIVRDGMLKDFGFNPAEEKMILDFVIDNKDHIRELSLRMVKKIADFVDVDKKGWFEMAEATCLSRDAKFKRLLAKKQKEAEEQGIVLLQ